MIANQTRSALSVLRTSGNQGAKPSKRRMMTKNKIKDKNGNNVFVGTRLKNVSYPGTARIVCVEVDDSGLACFKHPYLGIIRFLGDKELSTTKWIVDTQ